MGTLMEKLTARTVVDKKLHHTQAISRNSSLALRP